MEGIGLGIRQPGQGRKAAAAVKPPKVNDPPPFVKTYLKMDFGEIGGSSSTERRSGAY